MDIAPGLPHQDSSMQTVLCVCVCMNYIEIQKKAFCSNFWDVANKSTVNQFMLFMRFLLISFLRLSLLIYSGFLGGLLVKNLLCRSRSRHGLAVSIPRSGRCPGGGNDNPLQYSCQDNLMDRGAWQAGLYGAHGVTKSQT